MHVEDMTDRQIALRVNRIARELYSYGSNGQSHVGAVIDRDTLDYSDGQYDELQHNYRDDDSQLVMPAYSPYAGKSWRDAAEQIRESLGI